MRTASGPVPRRHVHPGGAGRSDDAALARIGRRLGVGGASVRAYLDSHGGAPDGSDPQRHAHDMVAGLVDPRALTHALPASCGGPRREAWVKRDRPRWFMPG